MNRYTYVVEGTGEFPIDMLRYDVSQPFREDDRKVVNAKFDNDPESVLWDDTTGRLRKNRVTLVTERQRRRGLDFYPCCDRWRSHVWSVIEMPKLVV